MRTTNYYQGPLTMMILLQEYNVLLICYTTVRATRERMLQARGKLHKGYMRPITNTHLHGGCRLSYPLKSGCISSAATQFPLETPVG